MLSGYKTFQRRALAICRKWIWWFSRISRGKAETKDEQSEATLIDFLVFFHFVVSRWIMEMKEHLADFGLELIETRANSLNCNSISPRQDKRNRNFLSVNYVQFSRLSCLSIATFYIDNHARHRKEEKRHRNLMSNHYPTFIYHSAHDIDDTSLLRLDLHRLL